MLLAFDAKQLEWRAIAHLANDAIAIKEISEGLDTHSDNQKAFGLPSRLIAKIFLFRAIYKGSAYAYSVDNDFKHIGGQKYWQNIIDKFYEKYTGIYQYHNKIIQQATLNGFLVSETGRRYDFEPAIRRGEVKWPINDIVNYPVQGFSADLMSMLRVSLRNRLKAQYDSPPLFVNTVHDSVVFDVDKSIKECYNICITVKKAFRDIPKNYAKIYGKELLVPMDCDAKIGINWLWQHELKIKEEDLI